MLLTAGAVWLLTYAHTHPMFLLAALGVGLAGGSFAVGVAYVALVPEENQGTALGIFGMGNVGAAVTKFPPFVMVAWGWHAVAPSGPRRSSSWRWSSFFQDDPTFARRKAGPGKYARRRSATSSNAPAQPPGLALLALLLLRLRRLRRAGAVAAELPSASGAPSRAGPRRDLHLGVAVPGIYGGTCPDRFGARR